MAGRDVTSTELSEITGWSRDKIRWLLGKGLPYVTKPKSRGGDWLFNTASVFEWALEYGKRSETTSQEDLDLNAERARLTKEQADRAELDNASLRGELVRRQLLESALSGMDASLKDRLMMVPTSAAPEALTAGETAGSPGIAEVYRRHIGQALSDVAAANLVSTIAN
jgi:phage terminase Nu1 subunit (DNA packaging protein)